VNVESRISDVAWVVGPAYQGRGFAREAGESMLALLRANGAAGFTAYINPENRPSESVARAIGLAPTREMRAGERRWES
jgi:RimJ/RimL family protein N-acetyltransferase